MEAAGQQPAERRAAAGAIPAPELLPAAWVVDASPVLKEPQLIGAHLFWLEQLPEERGRTTLRLREASGTERDLTPSLDLRSRIHGYGGGTWTACSTASGTTVVVVAEGGRSLWRLDLPASDAAVIGADPTTATAAALEPPVPVPLLPRPSSDRSPGAARDAAVMPQTATPQTATPPASEGESPEALYADGLIDAGRQRWIGVCESGGRDRLVAVSLAGGAAVTLHESPDFCGYAALSPTGSHLAWVSWQQPCMPWDRSQLWLGRFAADGSLVDARPVAGSRPGEGAACSVFQPLWAGDTLVVANDRSGWWNLEALAEATHLPPGDPPNWRPLLPQQAEFAMPQWVYGMRTTAWDGERLVAAACRQGVWELGTLTPPSLTPPSIDAVAARGRGAGTASGDDSNNHESHDDNHSDDNTGDNTKSSRAAAECPEPWLSNPVRAQAAGSAGPSRPVAPSGGSSAYPTTTGLTITPWHWQPIPLPFDDLAGLSAEAGRVVAIASGPAEGPGLLELDLASGHWSHRPAAPARLAAAAISQAESLWFRGHGDRPTQAWYYPPLGGSPAPAPLLIKGHSGPTAMARTGLSLAIQFWTSRGWGVVDVNYGGSTGFGRAYRERLDGQWGVVDVDDCLAAAQALVTAGRADPARIAMEGSSASGFTVLAAIARDQTIRAGACRYPVTDLTALAEGDHRFEARYFEALVGPWPEARSLYLERSPLHQVARLQAPLLLFHGLDDRVVPPAQSQALAERLQQQGVPVELHLFPGEGHGFRDAAVQRQVLESTEAFFRRQFSPDGVER